jgi:hypothetical protein
MTKEIITQDYVKQLFEYRDGVLYWKVKHSKKVNVGEKAGNVGYRGYIRVGFNQKKYSIHRIIFLIHYGYLPEFLDHIDENKANNKIENLRPATRSENRYNIKKQVNNTSGVKGVCWNKRDKKWQVQITINGKQKTLGQFNNIELADLVAQEARNKYHGAFVNHG